MWLEFQHPFNQDVKQEAIAPIRRVKRIKNETSWISFQIEKSESLELQKYDVTQGPPYQQSVTPKNTSFTLLCQRTMQEDVKC